MVIELFVVEDLHHGFDGTGLGVVGTVNEAADARVGYGAGTHGARFDGDVEIAITEAVIAERVSGFAEGDNFGVGGGVGVGDRAIAATGNDLAFADDDGADGNFGESCGALSFAERFFHPKFIWLKVHGASGTTFPEESSSKRVGVFYLV